MKEAFLVNMKLSVVVLTFNSAEIIGRCLESVKWADEVVVVDSGSTDQTLAIAKKFTGKIYCRKLTSFAEQRNFAFAKTRGDWVFYLDADERIDRDLRNEMKKVMAEGKNSAYQIPRQNFFFGRKIRYGGYWPDYETRLFRRQDFDRWTGKIHESPSYRGTLGRVNRPLIHLTHRNLLEGLYKSARWTKLEAELFFDAGHPQVTVFHLIKVMLWEFVYRYVKRQGFRDGLVGFMEAMIQAWNRFLVYVQIWELQQKPSIEDQYKKIETKIRY